MPSLRILVLLLCGVVIASAEDSPRKLAFERDRTVWVANLDGTGAKKVGTGIFPDLSPDGSKVTFNTEEQNGKTEWMRHIAVVDLASGQESVFKDVPSVNVMYPKWSPDGTQILFSIYDGKAWHLVTINADGTGFRYVRKGKEGEMTRSSPSWAPDGKSFFVQDMKNIYRVSLDGSDIAQWDIAKSIPNGEMSGEGRIEVSPDGQKLLLGIDMNEEAHRKDWDGPLPAVWTFDLASKKATRLTPKKLFGWDGCWVDNGSILFLSRAPGEKNDSIYRMALPGGAVSKALEKNATQPTVSR